MFKKMLVAALLVSATVLIGMAPAGAGEWNPAKGYMHGPDHSGLHPGNSICAYSGLDDPDVDDDEMWGASPAQGRVQSPGQVVALFGPGAAGIPGAECRGNAGLSE